MKLFPCLVLNNPFSPSLSTPPHFGRTVSPTQSQEILVLPFLAPSSLSLNLSSPGTFPHFSLLVFFAFLSIRPEVDTDLHAPIQFLAQVFVFLSSDLSPHGVFFPHGVGISTFSKQPPPPSTKTCRPFNLFPSSQAPVFFPPPDTLRLRFFEAISSFLGISSPFANAPLVSHSTPAFPFFSGNVSQQRRLTSGFFRCLSQLIVSFCRVAQFSPAFFHFSLNRLRLS